MNTKHIAFILILIAVSGRTEAQTVVEGTVTDSLGMAVEASSALQTPTRREIISWKSRRLQIH